MPRLILAMDDAVLTITWLEEDRDVAGRIVYHAVHTTRTRS